MKYIALLAVLTLLQVGCGGKLVYFTDTRVLFNRCEPVREVARGAPTVQGSPSDPRP